MAKAESGGGGGTRSGATGVGDESGEDDRRWVADLAAAAQRWPEGPPVERLEDLFTVVVDLGEGGEIAAPTHLFGDEVVVVPYEDHDRARTADGVELGAGDREIARRFPPGRIGFAVKHHRPSHRRLSAEVDERQAKEHLKLQDTHVEIVVGIDRSGTPGAMTINNPQSYQNGRFGDASYPMIFVRPTWPEYLSVEQAAAFEDNVRTMAACFNTVSEFPGDYNGGDPLAASSPAEVRVHVRQMLLALAGDEAERVAARAWFDSAEHQVYCAELAHLASSAGLLAPLNRATVTDLAGGAVWDRFAKMVEEHRAGRPTALVEDNDNPWIGQVELSLAPDDLEAAPSYAPDARRAGEEAKLAFRPLTPADILEQAIRAHFPRQRLGESIAPVQAAVLEKMRPGMMEAMGLEALPPSDPRRAAVDTVYDEAVETVGRQYGSYEEMRQALAPVMERARKLTGPRPGSTEGLFVPPSTLHLVAQGEHGGGLLGLEYVGHGLHWSLMRRG